MKATRSPASSGGRRAFAGEGVAGLADRADHVVVERSLAGARAHRADVVEGVVHGRPDQVVHGRVEHQEPAPLGPRR